MLLNFSGYDVENASQISVRDFWEISLHQILELGDQPKNQIKPKLSAWLDATRVSELSVGVRNHSRGVRSSWGQGSVQASQVLPPQLGKSNQKVLKVPQSWNQIIN